ncbi:hypothetical protein [Nocardia yamanashiensis]|uniref:hypothetical protein n=1 Tax=Nocardia yamanashiensis TaxID=209247 RepID=UPI000ADD1F67|nr:hypothetical protein [Nocardia yamanashiensis]
MAQYMLLYRGPARPLENFPAEQVQAQMRAWTRWTDRLSSALLSLGEPFGARSALTGNGSDATATELNGYSVIEADTIAHARLLCSEHPYLDGKSGTFVIEIFELTPMGR